MNVSTLILGVCFLMAGCACVYCVLVIVAALRFRATPEPPLDFAPPVSIFKPLHGLERDLDKILAGFCRQDYPEYEVLFAVGDPADPAVEVVQGLKRDFPGVPIRLVVADSCYGANRKVDSLDKMYREMRHQFMAISDSDMRVERHYLRRVMAQFRDPRVGLVTCFYRCQPGGTLASTFEAIGTTGEFHPSAMVARLLEGVKFAFGSTMATRKKLVEAIGGFPVLADYQGDDYEMGNRVAGLGHEVVISPYVVETVLPADTWRSMIQHQFRWVRSAAGSRPKGHVGLIFTYGLPFVLTALLLAPHSLAAWLLAATWLALRLSSAWVAGVYVLRDPTLRRNLLLLPVRELLSFGLWCASFFYKHITWKGRRYRVEKGKMIPLEE
jgi:ceramide glucosyltransferase